MIVCLSPVLSYIVDSLLLQFSWTSARFKLWYPDFPKEPGTRVEQAEGAVHVNVSEPGTVRVWPVDPIALE